jgi:hypothetical protein
LDFVLQAVAARSCRLTFLSSQYTSYFLWLRVFFVREIASGEFWQAIREAVFFVALSDEVGVFVQEKSDVP